MKQKEKHLSETQKCVERRQDHKPERLLKSKTTKGIIWRLMDTEGSSKHQMDDFGFQKKQKEEHVWHPKLTIWNS